MRTDPLTDYRIEANTYSPLEEIVVRLCKRWDRSDAVVLADWCEERCLMGMVWNLQRVIKAESPDDDIRNNIHALGSMMGIDYLRLELTDRHDWLHPGRRAKIAEAKCCGLEWKGGMRKLAQHQDPVWRIRGIRHRAGPLNICTRPKDHKGPHHYDAHFGEDPL